MKPSLPTKRGYVLRLLLALALLLCGYLTHPQFAWLHVVMLVCTLSLAAMYFPLVFPR